MLDRGGLVARRVRRERRRCISDESGGRSADGLADRPVPRHRKRAIGPAVCRPAVRSSRRGPTAAVRVPGIGGSGPAGPGCHQLCVPRRRAAPAATTRPRSPHDGSARGIGPTGRGELPLVRDRGPGGRARRSARTGASFVPTGSRHLLGFGRADRRPSGSRGRPRRGRRRRALHRDAGGHRRRTSCETEPRGVGASIPPWPARPGTLARSSLSGAGVPPARVAARRRRSLPVGRTSSCGAPSGPAAGRCAGRHVGDTSLEDEKTTLSLAERQPKCALMRSGSPWSSTTFTTR
jgi:hypothetical protein